MGEKLSLKLDERTVHGKKVAKLRKEGLVPAVVYGPGIDPISVQVEDGVFTKLYRQAGTYTPVHLTIGAKKKIAMIKMSTATQLRARYVTYRSTPSRRTSRSLPKFRFTWSARANQKLKKPG